MAQDVWDAYWVSDALIRCKIQIKMWEIIAKAI